MKKIALLLTAIVLISSTAFFTSCNTEDLTKPIITLTGGEDTNIVIGATWTDPGFTATDDEDGDVTASVTVTGTVNTALAGNYDLVYTVTDAAGNTGTITRTVTVYNESIGWAGTYTAVDTEDGTTYPAETRTVNASTTVNNRIFFTKFSGRTDADCYGDINTAASTINLPTQNYICGASPQQDMTFAGSGNLNTTTSVMTISYTVGLTGGSTSLNCNTVYTKQ